MDFEELLDAFYVRRTPVVEEKEDTSNAKGKVHTGKTYDCIPLLLKHLKSFQEAPANDPKRYHSIFHNRINFRLCLIYGRIIGLIKRTDRISKYILDDGTDSLDVCAFHEHEKLQKLYELENELLAIDEESANSQSQVMKSLKQILLKIKEQVDYSQIPIGCKVIILGRPNVYKGEIGINAFSISADNCPSRRNEIAFKTLLMRWYSENLCDPLNS